MRNGYSDPTADMTIANVMREQRRKEREQERGYGRKNRSVKEEQERMREIVERYTKRERGK